ncbi:thiamine pyrophosphate-dependent dehydrogenase E1 component subunit alpha [Pollutimonas harenae]|uniref:Thiamine pyrophosphate-dependent dehydrogenase E1 component subunit alpha n=1 Tax=Pollutimonas harenae TaxID=657015 RepID=A0A853H3Y3_9BURK|nr:thiamine pyrophosphate-dependent dehydrogenase E1 component subunit alpha [Pollutimonas harenae]NYT84844.1 thiamine pyrophosphate-dependent dehydrogenase E1 component subunit alpha [Pollutimonas harenae]TEA72758.1 thiamine pyrophosphate-dependent dehydrogenase E1 component subunit alpha [Pollutimonas harenae]
MPETLTVDELLALYRTIKTIRTVENSLTRLFADGEVPGFIHLSVGQEAIAAGICSALGDHDTLATTHRGHGHVLARGLSLPHFFKEVMGKAGGVCGGRGGSMHVADMEIGILGANGIVAAGIPIAMGSAVAHQTRKTGGIAVAFFGDGAMAEGVLHETLNMAALWKLPLLLVCENNGWSEFSPTSQQFAGTLKGLAAAFKISHQQLDGNDVSDVALATRKAVASLRKGKGPLILECVTKRVRGHYEGDPQKYRDADDLASLEAVDPVARTQVLLQEAGATKEQVDQVDQEVEADVDAAIAQAREDSEPTYESARQDVYTLNI